ncbi:MAG TPA: F0F1 ATP synthase subunit B [Pseudonocardiaceae bacterium]|jgi:F-type H+-transporting ATPase subunit b|nr:F0F1 ATP synthase subunit B [Pseudonocardiaceae bacterium]
MRTTAAATNNFLIPNGTFFVELIIFVIVLLVLGWYVGPAIGKALRDRQEMVDRQIKESQQAAEKLAAAEKRYAEALHEARAESGRIRETARSEGQKVSEELRGQAHAEAEQIAQRGAAELAAQREQAVRELQGHVGELSVTLAGRVVGEDLPEELRTTTVRRFLGQLEGSL